MLRLLILAGLAYAAFRAVKSVTGGGRDGSSGAGPDHGIEDVMVKDPACGVYFPKSQCIAVHGDGGDLYFCSEKCRDLYMDARKERPSQEN